jgi:hypothetical protein
MDMDIMDKHHEYQKGFINNPEMSDVVFIIGDEKIYAHRCDKLKLFNDVKVLINV